MTAGDLRLTLPATPGNVIVVRQAVAGLGEAVGLSAPRVADLKTVVSEACNNVVLHAYGDDPGPLEVTAEPRSGELVIQIADRGMGFRPRANEGEESLGLGLPLIAALSDGFEISGAAGQGSRTTIRFSYEAAEPSSNGNGADTEVSEELDLEIAPGELVKPVIARVIGALAARAEFPVDRLADTVLLGDAVSDSSEGNFTTGRIALSIRDGDGTLKLRVGPLVEGAGQRLIDEMEIPGAGSLSSLTDGMEVTSGETPEGAEAEYLEFEVSR